MFSSLGQPQVVQYSLNTMGRSCSTAGPWLIAAIWPEVNRWAASSRESAVQAVRMASGVVIASPGVKVLRQ